MTNVLNVFLTKEELTELTGCSTKMGQRNVLTRNGVTHTVRKDGWPSVTWYQVNHPNQNTMETSGSEPDFEALLETA